MATDIEKLVVSLEASITKYERTMNKAMQTTTSTTRNMERRFNDSAAKVESRMQRMGRGVSASLAGIQAGMSGAFGMARGALGIAGIGLGAAGLANLTSEWSDLNSRVNNAVGSMSRGAEVMGRITEMARRSYSSLTQTAEGFLQNADALTELGYNTSQQLNMTEALNNAMVISATRGQQAEAVMRAWSQALALGELRGDNLNTVIQNSSRLTRALAESMGVSVNSLRSMGAAGEITARDMMGVSSQLEQLRAEADAMPATITDSFVLLGNAIMQFVGQADQATGATGWLAGEIIVLADSIEEASRRWEEGDVPVLRFMEAAAGLSRELGLLRESVEDTRSEVEQVEGSVVDARQAVIEFTSELTMLQNMRDFAPSLVDEIQEIIDELLLGETSANEARNALLQLGAANLDFSSQIAQLAQLVGNLRAATNAAADMHAALNMPGGPTGDGAGRGGAGASRRAALEREAALTAYTDERERVLGLTREQLSLETAIAREIKSAADAGITLSQAEAERLARLQLAQTTAHRASGSGGRGGGSGGSDTYANAVEQQRERLRMLEMETALTRTLSPLVNDYGYAVERLRTQMELENAATEAGLELTPERRAEIEQLAEGYATATANAARLAEAQDKVREAAEAMGEAGRQALDTIVQGFIDGQNAGEIFGQVLSQLGSVLLNMGLSGLGQSFGIPGFANGTLNAPGGMAIVGERGPELVNLPKGAQVIPNYRTKQMLSGSGGATITFAPVIDARGADVAAVARLEQVVARQQAEFDVRVQRIVRSRGKKWID